ncbi:MAG: phospho-sugar mutase, partial [Clostridia bacterium]|nr:phospho-sugar mutase [Clostridia bacterium]
MDYLNEYNRWLSSDKVDEKTKEELKNYDEETKKLYFHGFLSFGTAGLRGVMAAGTNAMNVYTVAHATQGLSDLVNAEKRADDGVVIAYDSRNNSELFAKTAAEVLCGNGIKTYLFESLRPTPVLSFAVRYLKCAAGVNITASHNPKQYNGYKAYWEDGAQLAPALADKVSSYMSRVDILDGIKKTPLDKAEKQGILKYIGEDVDKPYLDAVEAQLIDRQTVAHAADLGIVYSPLNGAGYQMVPEILRRIGIKNLHIVPEQAEPDGEFPTTPFPNPEFKQVFEPGIKIADRIGSDLIIATDPDADRMGIAVRQKDGQFVTLTGNQQGALLIEYIITALKNTGKYPKHPYVIKSFVSTELAAKIARDNGCECYDVFTGFKYIGEKMNMTENDGTDTHFLLGFEESCGYLRGTYARDKDAVVAAMLICEAAAYYSQQGKNLYDAMQDIYKKYGYYREATDSAYME